jgi:hypothetical protein
MWSQFPFLRTTLRRRRGRRQRGGYIASKDASRLSRIRSRQSMTLRSHKKGRRGDSLSHRRFRNRVTDTHK